jgi:hypothetical protein
MQFHFCEYINWNQTFILGSHRPFIYGVCLIFYQGFYYASNSIRGFLSKQLMYLQYVTP